MWVRDYISRSMMSVFYSILAVNGETILQFETCLFRRNCGYVIDCYTVDEPLFQPTWGNKGQSIMTYHSIHLNV